MSESILYRSLKDLEEVWKMISICRMFLWFRLWVFTQVDLLETDLVVQFGPTCVALYCRINMSADLQWMIIRNNSSFLLKGSGQTFSRVCTYIYIYVGLTCQVTSRFWKPRCSQIYRTWPASLQEPNNLRNRNSFRYNGLVHKKTIGVEPAVDGKGVVLVTKNSKSKIFCGNHLSATEIKDAWRESKNGFGFPTDAAGFV